MRRARTSRERSAAISSRDTRPEARLDSRWRADRPCPAPMAQFRNVSSWAAGSRHNAIASSAVPSRPSTERDGSRSSTNARSPFAAAASKNHPTVAAAAGTTTASNHPAFSTTGGKSTWASTAAVPLVVLLVFGVGASAATMRGCGFGHVDPANAPCCDANRTMSVVQLIRGADAATAAEAILSPDNRRSKAPHSSAVLTHPCQLSAHALKCNTVRRRTGRYAAPASTAAAAGESERRNAAVGATPVPRTSSLWSERHPCVAVVDKRKHERRLLEQARVSESASKKAARSRISHIHIHTHTSMVQKRAAHCHRTRSRVAHRAREFLFGR